VAEFKLTPKQEEAQEILNGPAKHVMLAGGSRSGKTFLIVRKIIQRRLKAPGSRGVILRFRFGHVKNSIMLDTFPKVMSICFPGVPYDINQTLGYATFPGGSEQWFGGLDDKIRTEKILGTEYSDIFLNEYATTRLATISS
jgi:phage terminase large subunit